MKRKRFFYLVFTVFFAVIVLASFQHALTQESAEELYEAAVFKKESEGDMNGAIQIFLKIVKEFPGNKKMAGKAQLQIGMCYEKFGELEAIKAYELVLKNYADQPDLVATARTRLVALREKKPSGQSIVRIISGEAADTQALSPDGTKLAIMDYSKGQNVAVYDWSTKRTKFITNFDWSGSAKWTYYAIWSPDGKEIAYLQAGWAPSSPAELVTSTLDGKSRVICRIENMEEEGAPVPYDWLNDGSAIVAALLAYDETQTLGLVSLADGAFKALCPLKGKYIIAKRPIDASPDGRFIVFDDGSEKGKHDIYIVSIDGKSLEVLTDHPADDIEPRWSPDGKHIVFSSQRHGDWALWGLAVKDGKPAGEPFLVMEGNLDLLNWTKHGLVYRNILMMRDVFTVPIDSETKEFAGKPRQVEYTPTGSNMNPIWSPDGKYLAFVSSWKIVLLPDTGGNARQFKMPANCSSKSNSNDLRWLPDSSGLSFSGFDENGEPTLFRLSIANEKWKTWPIPVEWWTYIEWSSDGNTFIYAKHGPDSEEASIIEHNLESGLERYIFRPEQGWEGVFRELKLSQDQKWLAFRKHSLEADSIVAVEMETGKWHKVTSGKHPAWSPNGEHLLVTGSPNKLGKSTAMYLVSIKGGPLKKLELGLPKGKTVSSPDWSPDGKKIVFVVGSTKLETLLIKNVIIK